MNLERINKIFKVFNYDQQIIPHVLFFTLKGFYGDIQQKIQSIRNKRLIASWRTNQQEDENEDEELEFEFPSYDSDEIEWTDDDYDELNDYNEF